ncbi:hypothetical protein ACKWTF_003842 [Chironomus riparius]
MGERCVKFTNCVANTICFIFGISGMVLILIGGISLKENGQEDEKILLIIIGAIILVVSMIGCRTSRCNCEDVFGLCCE